jgi:hypothetical protein
MTIATHSVEVPFPQAFASPAKKRSPFPSAPGTVVHHHTRLIDLRPPGGNAPSIEALRCLSAKLHRHTLLRSCFYPRERCTVEREQKHS